MKNHAKVAAIIVTYNRPQMLRQQLELLRNTGVEAVVLVNNGGEVDLDTLEVAANMKGEFSQFHLINSEENLGAAGGFHFGIIKALELGVKYVWLMDDDVFPQESSLRELVDVVHEFINERQLNSIGFFSSKVLWTDDRLHQMNSPSFLNRGVSRKLGYPLLKSASFVSLLIPVEHILKVGLPIKEFFIWCDDVEFTRRLSKIIGPGVYCEKSEVIHNTVSNMGVNFSLIEKNNSWKYRYGLRNQIALTVSGEFEWQSLQKSFLAIFRVIFGKSTIGTKAKVLSGLFEVPELVKIIRNSTELGLQSKKRAVV